MGLVSALSGNAGEVSPAEMQQQLQPLLVQGEQVQKAYQVGRDAIVFTDRRLILVDRQGITGNKVEYQTIPYRSVQFFSVENAGSFDLDAELRIQVAGQAMPISKNFNKKVNVFEVQQVLAWYTTR
jgi:hypothetical protein